MPQLVEPPYTNVSTRTCFVMQSNDGWAYVIRRDAAGSIMHTLSNFVGKLGYDSVTVLPLPQLDGRTLGIVIDYAERKFDSGVRGSTPTTYADIADWEKQFLVHEALKEEGNPEVLRKLVYAAEVLNIGSLVTLLELYFEKLAVSMTNEQFISTYGISNIVKFTPEEEALLANLEYKKE
eukprot:PhF_6_TR9468/c0_g1_i1/m.14788/K03094/SKP1, CBF3D; S-phase kinase-associated protein 1